MMKKLPVTGDLIDPEVARVGSIFVRRGQDSPAPPAVIIVASIGVQPVNHVLECKTDDEAYAMRDAVACQLGYVTPEMTEAAGQTRQ